MYVSPEGCMECVLKDVWNVHILKDVLTVS